MSAQEKTGEEFLRKREVEQLLRIRSKVRFVFDSSRLITFLMGDRIRQELALMDCVDRARSIVQDFSKSLLMNSRGDRDAAVSQILARIDSILIKLGVDPETASKGSSGQTNTTDDGTPSEQFDHEQLNRSPRPLTDAQREVWSLLHGRALTGKEIAQKLEGTIVSEEAIRKRIRAIRESGRQIDSVSGLGYLRPDCPPPDEDTGRKPESDQAHDGGTDLR